MAEGKEENPLKEHYCSEISVNKVSCMGFSPPSGMSDSVLSN